MAKKKAKKKTATKRMAKEATSKRRVAGRAAPKAKAKLRKSAGENRPSTSKTTAIQKKPPTNRTKQKAKSKRSGTDRDTKILRSAIWDLAPVRFVDAMQRDEPGVRRLFEKAMKRAIRQSEDAIPPPPVHPHDGCLNKRNRLRCPAPYECNAGYRASLRCAVIALLAAVRLDQDLATARADRLDGRQVAEALFRMGNTPVQEWRPIAKNARFFVTSARTGPGQS